MIGLYITDLAAGAEHSTILSVKTVERRLAGLAWSFAQRGFHLERTDRYIATAIAEIKRKHARPKRQKTAISTNDILAMIATLPFDLRGLRDRAILLIGFAGGLRRSEIISLDVLPYSTREGGNRIEILEEGALLTLRAKSGWREVKIGRGSSEQTCPVHALEQWLTFAKISVGPVFVGISRDGKRALEARLNDKHVARLIKQAVLDAGIRSELPENERLALFSGHSLRTGLASSVSIEENDLPNSRWSASFDINRNSGRRRKRFGVNLTKAVGL